MTLFCVGDIVTYKQDRYTTVKAEIKRIFDSSTGEQAAIVAQVDNPAFEQLQLVKNLTKVE